MKTRAVYDEANGEWVLNGTKTWATNGGIADWHVDRRVGRPVARRPAARCRSSYRPARKGLSQGQKFKKHGIRASHTAEVVLDDVRLPGEVPARRQGQARRPAGPGPRGPEDRPVAAVDGDLRAHPPDGRRAGRRHRPRGLRGRARLREDARAVRPPDHREPGHRVQARRHEDPDRRLAAAGLARGVDGPAGQAVHRRRGLAVQAVRRRDRGLGHRAGDPDPRRQRLHPRVPGRADAPRRQDLHDLRGHQSRSSAWSSPARSAGCRSAEPTQLECAAGGRARPCEGRRRRTQRGFATARRSSTYAAAAARQAGTRSSRSRWSSTSSRHERALGPQRPVDLAAQHGYARSDRLEPHPRHRSSRPPAPRRRTGGRAGPPGRAVVGPAPTSGSSTVRQAPPRPSRRHHPVDGVLRHPPIRRELAADDDHDAVAVQQRVPPREVGG